VGAGRLLGIEVLDHIVIGRGHYVSLKDKGVIDGRQQEAPRRPEGEVLVPKSRVCHLAVR
jgi:hypothetical protein